MSTEPLHSQRSTGNRTRVTLLFLLALLVAPVLFVQYALYQGWFEDAERTTNHGERMQPPVGLIQLNPAPDSILLTEGLLADAWWVLYIVPESCDAACERGLHQWAQVTEQLNLSRPVERLLIEPYERASVVAETLDGMDPVFTLSVSPAAVNASLSEWTGSSQSAIDAGYFYLMNPQGSLMMNYPPMADDEASVMRLREDLGKLLRVPG